MGQNSISMRRHELYNLVWSEPMTRLAKKYGFSDVWLAKICKKFNIPRPGRGYWARKHTGERVPVARLPKRVDDPLIEIRIYPTRPNKDKESCNDLSIGQVPKNIIVPNELTDPHPLIKQAARTLVSSKVDDTGILAPPKGHCLIVCVSRESLDRALLIMDTLIKALLKVGFQISLSEGSTIVSVDGVSLGIVIGEGVKRRRIKAAEHDLDGYYRFGYNLYADRAVPSGILFLMIDDKEVRYHMASRRTWKDTETKRLENCLSSFITGMIKAANIKRSLNQKEAASNQEPEHPGEDDASKDI